MRKIIVLMLLAWSLVACAGAASSSDSYVSEPAMGYDTAAGAPEAMPAAEAPMPAREEFSSDKAANVGDISKPLNPGERLVIRDASIGIETEDVQAADQKIRAMVTSRGGYVLSSSVSGSDADIVIYLSLKVPSADLDTVLTEIEGMSHKIRYRNMSGSDVTTEYIDLEGRLTSLEASRDRMLELLKKAEKIEDAVAVNQALTDVQGQIESITGQMRYLRQSAALSSLNVELYPIPVIPVVDPDSWQPLEELRLALRGLVDFAKELVVFLINLAVWTPVWLPLLLLFRYLRRRYNAKQTPPQPPTPSE